MARKSVSAAVVRDWFAGLSEKEQEGITAPGSRGRLAADTVEAFHKANKGKRYEVGTGSESTVTFKYPATDSRGRNITKKVTLTTAEARAMLGHDAGRKGRLPMQALRDAYVASL